MGERLLAIALVDRLCGRLLAHPRSLQVVSLLVGVLLALLTLHPLLWPPAPRTMSLVVRTAGEPLNLVPSIGAQVTRLDAELPLGRTRTLDQLMSESVARPRFRTALLVMFGAAALLLAAIGIYGVMVYSVTERTREMGIRMALGAQAADVVKLIVREGSALALVGVGIGVAAALVLARFISGLLFKIDPADPLTFAGVSLVLIGAALVACWLPARRATRADPLIALRAE